MSTSPLQMFADSPIPLALTEAGEQAVAETTEPRTWSFINRRTGETMTYTCMDGCTLDHTQEIGRDIFPEDVWCWFWGKDLTLPVNENGSPEEFRVLSTVIKVEPWSPKLSERLPFAVVELVDDMFIEGLDPDGYETLINTFAERLDQMRAAHRQLVEVREAYRKRASRTVRSQAGEALRQVRGGAA
ncbi:DUF6907 domain-containing protein [Streptomyces sp. NPDC060006]|uniref:DUF6907 domain-containing protein n=1 Tax=unclassified Streptomyces TaxID=2593676 RepID=UPI0036A730DF